MRDYERGLCLDDATAYCRYACGGVDYRREVFVSYPDRVHSSGLGRRAGAGIQRVPGEGRRAGLRNAGRTAFRVHLPGPEYRFRRPRDRDLQGDGLQTRRQRGKRRARSDHQPCDATGPRTLPASCPATELTDKV
ncbi:MAG: glycoside hydrolase N-terminal domain-containing protein [Kiritimatiellia bacterium]